MAATRPGVFVTSVVAITNSAMLRNKMDEFDCDGFINMKRVNHGKDHVGGSDVSEGVTSFLRKTHVTSTYK